MNVPKKTVERVRVKKSGRRTVSGQTDRQKDEDRPTDRQTEWEEINQRKATTRNSDIYIYIYILEN